MIRYNVYGTLDCKACNDVNSTLAHISKARDDVEYNFYDIDKQENAEKLLQLLPDFKNDSSTPVIQKCTPDGKCTITRGYRESDYEQ